VVLLVAALCSGSTYIVQLAPTYRDQWERDAFFKRHVATPLFYHPPSGLALAAVPATSLDGVRIDPACQLVEQSQIVASIHQVGADPLLAHQWPLVKRFTPRTDVYVEEAHLIWQGSDEVIVGIIDTGIDYKHPDLLPNIATNGREIPGNGKDDDANGYVDDYLGWDFTTDFCYSAGCQFGTEPMDQLSHGTHVAGIVAAAGFNDIGVRGIAPRCRVLALKGISDQGYGRTDWLVRAILYAADNGVDIINASWGSAVYSEAIRAAIAYAGSKGVLFVAAAGNNTRDTDEAPFYPACYDEPNIINVGGSDSTGNYSPFSNFGRQSVDLLAPGLHIFNTVSGSDYAANTGTSMSAPHVAGAAALLKSYDQRLGPSVLIEAILGTVTPFENGRVYCKTGGILNVYEALKNVHYFQKISPQLLYPFLKEML